ncbi:MAG: phage portal protein [Desulforudis sp.]|nr:MAG: phage portal protein [Desulforudis sp.]
MGFWARLFRREVKASKVQGLLAGGTFGGATWPEARYDVYARETYLTNVVAFRCIDEVSKAVASVPWLLYRRASNGDLEEAPDHPLVSLLRRPNPDDSLAFLILRAVAFLLMAGNVYFERVSPSTGANAGVPKELYVLRPDRVSVLIREDGPLAGSVKGFEYLVNGQKRTWETDPVTGRCDVLQLKTFHPLDDWYGAAATQSGAREIDTANQAAEWNKALLQNHGRPGMVILYKQELTDDQFDQLERMLRENHAGPDNAGQNLILWGEGVEVKPYNWSPAELDYVEGGREMARRICLAYGVPSLLLGLPGDNTYANYKEARQAFWETTVFWWLNFLRGEWNNWFFGDGCDGYFLDYVLDDVPALSPKRDALWERARTADFLTVNERREMVGYEAIDGGDVILVQATQAPLSSVAGAVDLNEGQNDGGEYADE